MPTDASSPTSSQERRGSSRVPVSASAKKPEGRDRRIEPRFPYQTVATLLRVSAGAGPDTMQKCWTRDLSPSGARIMSLQPIESPSILLRFLLPKLGSKLIEAIIVSRSTEEQSDMRNRTTTLYLYGVKFTKLLENVDAA